MKSKLFKSMMVLGALSGLSGPTFAASFKEFRTQDIEVKTLDKKANISIAAVVHDSLAQPCKAKNASNISTIVALHGLAHTAATWDGFISALFQPEINLNKAPRFLNKQICRVITFDMPGRGPLAVGDQANPFFPSQILPAVESLPRSTTDEPYLFRNLQLNDYASIATQVLSTLKTRGLLTRDVTVMGHSLGALIWQLAEEQMKKNRSSLFNLGVTKAVFLASSIPAPLPWSFADISTNMLLDRFRTVTETTGFIYGLPDSLFPLFFFSDKALFSSSVQYLMTGQGVPQGAMAQSPSVAEVQEKALNAIEPELIVYQLLRGQIQVGNTLIPPPSVRKGLFMPFIETVSVIYSEDPFSSKSEQMELAKHLWSANSSTPEETIASDSGYTASRSLLTPFRRVVFNPRAELGADAVETPRTSLTSSRANASIIEIKGPLAVHDFHVTSPKVLVKLLKD